MFPAENFPLPESGEGGGIVALDQPFQPEPADGSASKIDPLTVGGFSQGKGKIRSVGQDDMA